MPDQIRVPYTHLTVAEREQLHAWVDLHSVDHHRVPIDGVIELDDSGPVAEWRIEVFALRNGRPFLAAGIYGEEQVARLVLRRASKADLPWPTMPAPDPTPIVATAVDVSGWVLCCAPGQTAAARAHLDAQGDKATQVVETELCPPGQFLVIDSARVQRNLKQATAEITIPPVDYESWFAQDMALFRLRLLHEMTLTDRMSRPMRLMTGLGA